MEKIKVHVLRTGEVRVSPYLPFGGDNCNIIKASGITTPKSKWLWLPVFSFYIELPDKKILFDTGWNREMSPDGIFDKKAQIRSLGSRILYLVNQGRIAKGEAVNEQLAAMGVKPQDLDYVLLSHLDCDHANGLNQVKDAKHILVSKTEMEGIHHGGLQGKIRFQPRWWDGVDLKTFDWDRGSSESHQARLNGRVVTEEGEANGNEGPVGHSYDVLGDGRLKMINIPGHSEGLCALKIINSEGKYVLLYADGGYATKSWKEMITSGIALDKKLQKQSLGWIREQCMSPNCIASFASHDTEVKPQVVEF